jgi:uncharacterized protein
MTDSNLEIHKRVADPVHGTIGLTELEMRVIDTRAFQRLRNVKHLGLAHLVFPGADFSRFAHSLGVCHVTGRLLDALRSAGEQISLEEHQRYRLAGLLHDVGHYPLSHALEKPVIDFLRDRNAEEALFASVEGEESTPAPPGPVDQELDHEQVGRIILDEDQELRDVLTGAGLAPSEIAAIFTRSKNLMPGTSGERIEPLVNLVSSDLDADRIDFLLRTSKSTGLPYGAVDLDYILSQIHLDSEGRVCLHERAMRTVDHLLLARFFDSQQVAYHKTVAVLEEMAKDIVGQLLMTGILEIDASWIKRQLQQGSWHKFDDASLFKVFADALEQTDPSIDDLLRFKIEALLARRPPKLVASHENFRDLTKSNEDRGFERVVNEYRTTRDAAAEHFGLSGDLFYLWRRPAFQLSKIGATIPADELDQQTGVPNEKWAQSVRILPRMKNDGVSTAIVRMPGSLMSILSSHALDAVRLYVLEPPDRLGIAKEVRGWVNARLT